MKISDEIYFDGDNLLIDTPTKIIYTGTLINESPDAIYMHYGYGISWDNLQEAKLTKGVSGYECDITFSEFGDVNICFRSSNGTWDNNNSQNYTVHIDNVEHEIPTEDTLALVAMPTLKSRYLIRKKIRITFYKIIVFIGKLFSGKLIKRKSS